MARRVIFVLVLVAVASPAGAGEQAAIEQRFLAGLEALAAGDSGDAIRSFQAILAEDPTLHRVRLELARAYFVAEDWAAARREFVAVLSADIPDAVRANILRVLRQIDVRRGWSWTLDGGLRGGPSVPRRTRDEIDLNIGGQPLRFRLDPVETPDFGVFVQGSLERRQPFATLADGQTLSAIARVSGGADLFEGTGDFDEVGVGADLQLQVAWATTTATFGPTMRRRWFGGVRRDDAVGLGAFAEHRTPSGRVWFGRTDWSAIHDHLNANRSGDLYTVQAGLGQPLAARSLVIGSFGAGRFDADAAFERYRFVAGRVSAQTQLRGGWAPELTLAASHVVYDDTAPLFFEPRRDTALSVDVRLEQRNWFIGPFSPFVEGGYTRTFGNIELYDTFDWRYRAGLRRAF
ncbi:MAG: DUF560 domain-containing protein [Geminicoccaceae bacterium]|nr:MAG: DUF560 domain-containing protein [Geminicoccaceae bacterium]